MFFESCFLLLSSQTGSGVDFHPQHLLWSFPFWRNPAFPAQCSADGDPAVALPPVGWLLAAAPPLLFPVSARPDLSCPRWFLPRQTLPSVARDWNQEVVLGQPVTRSVVWKVREGFWQRRSTLCQVSWAKDWWRPPPPPSGWNMSRNCSSFFQWLFQTFPKAKQVVLQVNIFRYLGWAGVLLLLIGADHRAKGRTWQFLAPTLERVLCI